ncbi:lipocalin family protein [Arenibacter latericius]|uniref:lipocalin family protein n=1 Tax=Arenibacter latericius TaxID=86104 RepID=UPI00040A65A2|nr:lipocalin family protein [Arenibacter latericius]MDX1365045.1 lipocalin family protein [Arenibacter latericius]
MNNLVSKGKVIHILFLTIGVLFLGSCKIDGKSTAKNEEISKIKESTIDKDLLVGSWKDTSKSALHFSLLKNGTARSDNMKTLLYKNWKVKGNQITFTIKSIGNGTSSIDTITYIIEKLTRDKLILRDGTYQSEYTKK